MTGLSVLTIVRNREAHLRQLIAGLRRSILKPDELIVVDMSDTPVPRAEADFPVRIDRFATHGLPLAEARNRAAARSRFDRIIFLDVDCIPMADCLARLAEELDRHDALLCADVRYLGPNDARGEWDEADLLARGRPHPVRDFPEAGIRVETNPGLFWSLAFACRISTFHSLGGFDDQFDGYGAEDTDFGFRAAQAGLPLLFVGGAVACHQHHVSHDPPVQHLADIVRNARRFHKLWGLWPMSGWLASFRDMGLIDWSPSGVTQLRDATRDELAATREAVLN